MGVLVRKSELETAKRERDVRFERLRQQVDDYEPGERAAEEFLHWLKLLGLVLFVGSSVGAVVGVIVWLLAR